MLLFIPFAVASNARQSSADSLETRLKSHPRADTARITILNLLANQYYITEPAKGFKTANEALALAIKINDKLKLGECYLMVGRYYQIIASYEKELEYNQKALALFQELGDQPHIAKALVPIAMDYRLFLDYTHAIDFLQKAHTIFETIRDTAGMARCVGNIGVLYMNLQKPVQAIENYQKAYKLYSGKRDTGAMALALNNIGDGYMQMENYKAAMPFTKRALALYLQQNIKKGIGNSYTDLGIQYTELRNYDSALACLEIALPIYEQLDAKRNISIALNAFADVFANAPDNLLREKNITPVLKYVKALEYAQRGLAMAKEINDIDLQSQELEIISGLYEKQKDYANAFRAYKQYSTLKDSILNDDKKTQVTRLEMQYGFDKKQAVADAAAKQRQTVQYAVIAGLSIVFIFSIVIFYFYRKRKEADLNTQVADTEMKALRAQMSPHFMFNALNSITDYIDKDQNRTASEFTAKFARLMRTVLENSEHKEIPLEEDIKALELYMQLESLRMQNKFGYTIDIDSDIDAENTLIPPLMLQPFVENAIWHGMSQKEDKGHITITIRRDGDMLDCIVQDDGPGMKESNAAGTKTSLGMPITKARIAVINKRKRANASVIVANAGSGVKVVLRLPLQLKF